MPPTSPPVHSGEPIHRRTGLAMALAAVVAVFLACFAAITVLPAHAASTLLSQGKPALASSEENATYSAAKAVDGDAGTRWSSAWGAQEWLRVDLGATATITQVVLNWEDAYAQSFQIETSANGSDWTAITPATAGKVGSQTLNVTGTGRYVRMNGLSRATAWGYSLWEFQVYGTLGSASCGTANAAQGRPALASTEENATYAAAKAVDGDAGTRWSSAWGAQEWLRVDLGATASVCRVILNWEAAYAQSFQIEVSDTGSSWTAVTPPTTGKVGLQTLDVTGTGRYVRMNGLSRATAYGYSLWEFQVFTTGSTATPTPTPTPTPSPTPTGGDRSAPPLSFWGDTSGIPAAKNVLTVKVLNRTNGKYPDNQVFWSFNGQTHSIAEQPYIDMPANSAGRMYFYLGSPTGQYWDFIEFTVGASQFNGNTTRVDAFGLKLAMKLHTHDGQEAVVGEDYPTFQEDRATTFQKFANEVPAEFKPLAQVQAPYRIPAPGSYAGFRTGGANQNYMSSYAASLGYSATTEQIFGCSGPLSEAAAQCGALNRHVAQLPQSEWKTTSNFYKTAPANYYAKFWHDHSIDGKTYGFPYDDASEQSSYISYANPQWLLVAVGW